MRDRLSLLRVGGLPARFDARALARVGRSVDSPRAIPASLRSWGLAAGSRRYIPGTGWLSLNST